MMVLIDGVQYVPMPEPQTDKSLLAALEVRFDSDAGDNITVRDYLCVLLSKVWKETEGFNGKRPFGNSGWWWELFTPLALAGFLEASITGEGDDAEVDMTEEQVRAADAYVGRLIQAAFYGVQES